MTVIVPAQLVINPSFFEPGVILPFTQESGWMETLADSQPLPRLSEGDLAVYMKRMDLRTKVAAGQSAYNELPSVSMTLSLISTPTYLLRVRAEYDHHDTAAVGRYGVSIAEAYQLGMHQAMFQLARSAGLYGFNPAFGEGLVNTPGAAASTLPADTNGNTSLSTYDNGQMSQWLLSQWLQIRTTTNQLGQQNRCVILGPQRTLGLMEISIVQVTQFQREGAGSTSTAGVVDAVIRMSGGGDVTWCYDDSLIGKGAGGSDLVIMVIPEIKKPAQNKMSTNKFADLAPGMNITTTMYCDMPAPREIPTPLPGGAIDVLSEWRISSGWCVRPEAIRLLSIPF